MGTPTTAPLSNSTLSLPAELSFHRTSPPASATTIPHPLLVNSRLATTDLHSNAARSTPPAQPNNLELVSSPSRRSDAAEPLRHITHKRPYTKRRVRNISRR